MKTLSETLDVIVARWTQLHPKLPEQDYDPDWPSPCILQQNPQPGTRVQWRPVSQVTPHDMFQRLDETLPISTPSDVIAFYSEYWSDPIDVTFKGASWSLLQVWSPEDLERLRGNLIGHLLELKRKRRAPSWFVACSNENDQIISVLETGAVVLEQPGGFDRVEIATNLNELLEQLTVIKIN